jgi:hypothetical protein
MQQATFVVDDDAVHKRIFRILKHQTETLEDERVRRYS